MSFLIQHRSEEAFRVLKSELAIRPVFHRLYERIEAHIMIAFLGYCLWAWLKQKLKLTAPSLTPARVLESMSSIMLVEVSVQAAQRWKDLPAPDHRAGSRASIDPACSWAGTAL